MGKVGRARKRLRAIDLCCGAGGWACAARGLPIDIVAAFDLWPIAATTYRLNHPGTDVTVGDLRDPAIHAHALAVGVGADLVLGGIPCEWLSTYRHLQKVKHAELAVERATLDSCLQLVKELDPPFWCFEDVKQLVRELPLMTPWIEINARNYSAQRRKRVYVGVFPPPAPSKCPLVLKDKLRRGPYRIGTRAFGRNPQTHRTFTPKALLGAWPERKGPTVACISSRRDAEWAVVDPNVPGGIRQIEWQEAAGLQGFPDDYLFYGCPGDVATQIGRAVQIDTARAILTGIVAKARKEGILYKAKGAQHA